MRKKYTFVYGVFTEEFPRYSITENGEVYSWKRKNAPHKLKPGITSGCYLFVRLGDKNVKVHVAVATTYIGSRPQGLIVRHLDGNPLNNHYKNLAYGTVKENYEDARKHGCIPLGEDHKNNKLSLKQIENVKDMLEQGVKRKDIAAKLSVSVTLIRDIAIGKHWSCKI